MTYLLRLRVLIAVLFGRSLSMISVGDGRRFVVDLKHDVLMPVIAGGAPDPDPEADPEPSGDPEPDPDPDPEPKADPEPEPEPDPDPDKPSGPAKDINWKRAARAKEREAKKALKEKEDMAAKLKEYEDRDKSDQDKAIEAAREEGRTAALSEAQKERRADRLEVATTRLAAKGLAIGEGDDQETVKFADPEDAQVHIERMIARGDVDDVFNEDGTVDTDALTDALTELLAAKPHLAAKEKEAAPHKPKGKGDGGKGEPSAKDLEELSPDDHLKRIQRRRGD